MKKLVKIIGRSLVICLVCFLILGAIRYFNDRRYRPSEGIDVQQGLLSDINPLELDIEGVQIQEVRGDYLNGYHFKPEESKREGWLVLFGGSEGMVNHVLAGQLAEAGYETLAFYYFGQDNQAQELVEVPLDLFDEVLTYMDSHSNSQQPITVYGASKGAELALNLAVKYDEIDHVILMAPTAWNYQGLSQDFNNARSSWTWQGQPEAYISFADGGFTAGMGIFFDFFFNLPVTYRNMYMQATQGADNSEEARIKVEDTDAKILILAGEDDQMWPSAWSAQVIEDHATDQTEVHIFDGAGHIFGAPEVLYIPNAMINLGGDLESNIQADQEAQQIIVDKLAKWHDLKQ